MNLRVVIEDQCTLISVEGDLDASSSILLDQAIAQAVEASARNLLIDCSQLNYISSAGLGVFMSYLKEFEHNQIQLVLFAINDKVRGVFQILGLDELITIAETKAEAKLLINESTI